jgi:hypothetical protein
MPPPTKSSYIRIRLTPGLKRKLKAAARRRGTGVSQWLRDLLTRAVADEAGE